MYDRDTELRLTGALQLLESLFPPEEKDSKMFWIRRAFFTMSEVELAYWFDRFDLKKLRESEYRLQKLDL